MTMLLYGSVFLEHETGGHPENTERLRSVWAHLCDTGLDQQCRTMPWQLATIEQLTRVHELDYVQAVQRFAEQGGGRIEADTIVSPLSYHVALQASGAVCHAVEQVVNGSQPNALCLVRPPGHHARPANAMGFCLFNHIAVGARHAIDALGLGRVLIVDWDVHHGNGTQESFYEDEQVGFLSIHRFPFYPRTGDADETGHGAGLGTTTNVAVEFGTSRAIYLAAFRVALEDLARRIRPDLVMISAGFDAHRSDPIGSLGLEVEDFGELTRMVCAVADEYCAGRIVSVLEGGYNHRVLPHCVGAHLQGLLAA
jgi:acetoin utilization deacetylase AcuC-like enzyme